MTSCLAVDVLARLGQLYEPEADEPVPVDLDPDFLSKVRGYRSKGMAAKMIPGFAIAYNAVSNRRDTNELGRRAISFYGQQRVALPPAG